MPEVNTKYNYINKLQKDLSNNSYLYGNNYILTCDPSDTLINNNNNNNQYKIYLNSRASYYIHPFSQVSNCQNNFHNNKSLFNIKIPPRVPIDNSSSIFETYNQKQIQNVVSVNSNLYTNNLKSLYVNNENINKHTSKEGMFNASDRASPRGIKTKTEKSSILPNYGIDIKHNSYDRYLARKKSQYIKTELQDVNLKPKYGNKTFKFGVVRSNSCIKNC